MAIFVAKITNKIFTITFFNSLAGVHHRHLIKRVKTLHTPPISYDLSKKHYYINLTPKLLFMKKIFTSLVMVLLAFAYSVQTYAQGYWEITGEPVAAIEPGVNYVLQSPWGADPLYLSGTGVAKNTTDATLYNFETAGKTEDGIQLYRLKQVSTGLYLEDPKLSGGTVVMTASVTRAYIFSALIGKAVDSAVDLDGDGTEETLTEEWNNADPRTRYDPLDQVFENVFVLANKDVTSGWQAFHIWPGSGCFWNPQYTNTRIWYIYEIMKSSEFDDLNLYLQDYFPNGTEGMFTAGTKPGLVPEEFVNELNEAYKVAKELGDGVNDQAASVYAAAKDRLAKAYKSCLDNVVLVTEGFYILHNAPEANRASNACIMEKNGEMHWQTYDKPEVLTIADASYIWEVIPAKDNGWYLRNYGSNRYAGSMKENYKAVPTTETAKQVYDINLRAGGYFSVDQRGQHPNFPALHCDANADKKIVIWESTTNGSWWEFVQIDKSELESIEQQLEQNRLNEETKQLINEAKATYAKGFNYSSAATPDGLYQEDNMGLVTEAGKYFSYTPEATEGKLEDNGLLDNNQKTIFHSCWSTGDYKGIVHNICADLTQEYAAIAIKYSRRNAGNDGVAKVVHVYTSNDTTGGNWKEQGYMNLTYKYASNETYTDGKIENFTGIASVGFDKPYRFVRMDVEQTMSNATASSGIYFNFSELRVYEATYDKETSLIEVVPEEVKKQLTEAMAKAEAEVAEGNVSKETYDALVAAYDLFVEKFPNPDVVKNLYKEAEAQANGAVEGSDLGYFETGAIQALKDALANVKPEIKDLMSSEEIESAKIKIQAALDAFNAKLIVPEDGQCYYIMSATSSDVEGSAANNYLYAQDNDENTVKYAITDQMSSSPKYLWKAIKNEDGSYSFLNIGTGTYLGNPKQNNVLVKMSFDQDSVKIRSAKVAGQFNFICDENVFYNAQPSYGNLVTWNSANGSDNSAFTLTPWDTYSDPWDGNTITFPIQNQFAKIKSFPYNITGDAYNCTFYSVVGLNENLIILNEYTSSDIIPAGTPFIMIPNQAQEGEEITFGEFYMENTISADDPNIDYSFEPLEQNGMKAAIRSNDNISEGLLLFENKVIKAVDSDRAESNSGYFVKLPDATENTSNNTLEVAEDVITGIDNVVIVSNKNNGVYSISGVKVRNNADLNNLPKGIYIIGNKKVLVK